MSSINAIIDKIEELKEVQHEISEIEDKSVLSNLTKLNDRFKTMIDQMPDNFIENILLGNTNPMDIPNNIVTSFGEKPSYLWGLISKVINEAVRYTEAVESKDERLKDLSEKERKLKMELGIK